ncbi:MAG: phenylalanine--tRNA ligase subunit beta [Gammaproteobacteria bacterium]
MKIAYSHLAKFFKKPPTLDKLSKSLFQLGHEHEIVNEIFDLEITPNRGDCLSLLGLARDLNSFYPVKDDRKIYNGKIDTFDPRLTNNSENLCPNISFLEIEIDGKPVKYQAYLEKYFTELGINKNNFFTDISNYLAYETGQPTHCFDASKMNGEFSLQKRKKNEKFKTLLGEEIELEGENLVFTLDGKTISLAGVMGGESTSCTSNTTKVWVECAYFIPEEILGKARKYNLNSEAAYKFERGVDFLSQENVLRRFVSIVDDHAKIKSISIHQNIRKKEKIKISYSQDDVNKVIGNYIEEDQQLEILESLGFDKVGDLLIVPSHRSDIGQINDLAEEITRIIGYDNISAKPLLLPVTTKSMEKIFEEACRDFLVNQGFFEVINFPFNDTENPEANTVDNPLDKQRSKIRVCITKSLAANVVYNQNRQKDSIKMFEISDVYTKTGRERSIGVIVNGREGKNYNEFSSKLDYSYLKGALITMLSELLAAKIDFIVETRENYDFVEVVSLNGKKIGALGKLSNNFVNSKSKSSVYSFEIDITNIELPTVVSKPVSEYPAVYRDLSFSIDTLELIDDLNKKIEKVCSEFSILNELFVFDFFENKKMNILKVGYRFKFQSDKKSLTDTEVDKVMDKIIKISMSIDGIKIEGL